MKTTGISRRIDDVGRIVIPREIRKTLGIKSGDPIEIFTHDREIVLKKYDGLGGAVERLYSEFLSVQHDLDKLTAAQIRSHINALRKAVQSIGEED